MIVFYGVAAGLICDNKVGYRELNQDDYDVYVSRKF